MYSNDGKLRLNSKIKNNIYINNLVNVEEMATDIDKIIVDYLLKKCGAGNFVLETDVKF